MARGGFLGRIGRAIRDIIAPPRPSPPGEEPPPEEPPKRLPRDPYRQVWRDESRRGNYKKNLRIFHAMVDDIEPDEDERLELWDSFIRNIVNGEGRYRRNSTSNMFWRDSGIDPSVMDWRKWREAMGFTGKNRSRTA